MSADTLRNYLAWQYPFCVKVGGIAGAIVGLFIGFGQANLNPTMILTWRDLFLIGLVMGFIAWICLLVIVGLWLHYCIRTIALISLIIAIVVGVVTVFILNLIQFPPAAILLGLLLGMLIGGLVCWILCSSGGKFTTRSSKGRNTDG